ncbi:MAG: glycosyltransferase [Candidatus Riflebacteria bacterium]|nr:glycosyltransferase [Candidatus Riflebacteria bacterium]
MVTDASRARGGAGTAAAGPARLRVALIVNRLTVGGLERAVLTIATGLDPGRFEVRIVCLARAGALAERAASAGIPVTTLGSRVAVDPLALWHAAACLRKLVRWVRAFDPQVVQTHLFYSQFLGSLAARASPVRGLVHVEQNFYRWKNRVTRLVELWALGRRGVVVVPTRVLADHHGRRLGLGPDRVLVIPNGVELPPSVARPDTRATLRLPEGSVLVGVAERLVPAKRQALLLEAAALAAREEPRLHFVIVGDGPVRGALEARCRADDLNGRVRFVGETVEPMPWIASMDVYFTASTMEGFGIAPVEALALGVPVLAPAVPVFEETLGRSGAAHLVSPDSLREMAAHLVALARDPEERRLMGERGKEHARDRFGADAMVDAYGKLYETLAVR